MVRPINQFCCGCSLSFGCKLILGFNLVINLFYISTATANIILRVPTVGFGGDLANQTFNAAFCMVGLPFIAAAFYGVIKRQESHVRLYLYYMTLSFILDIGYVLVYLFIKDTCTMLPSVLKKHGSAFACGFARAFTIAFIVVLAGIQTYCIYTIWSMAEDIRVGGASSGFPELSKAKQASAGFVDGVFGTGTFGDDMSRPLNYGSLATPGIGGGSRFFGGTQHDVNYPPKM